MNLKQISTPRLLLNEEICRKNMKRMQLEATNAHCKLRPHFKTHQSHQIGRWMRGMGIESIAVSSLQMAEYFAADAWEDILVAFPVNIREMERINRLAKAINLQLILESSEALHQLNAALESQLDVFIELDLDYGRSGLPLRNFEQIDLLLDEFDRAKNIRFKGFMGHAGQSYQCRSADEIQALHEELLQGIRLLRSRYQGRYPQLQISIGDTPTCSKAEGWEGVDEMRPGNYVFYDLMQWQIGACKLEDIAVALAAPVVAKHPDKLEVILHGGGVHLCKDYIDLNGVPCYGLLAKLTESGWELPQRNNYLKSLSQEHGIAKVNQTFFDRLKVGDLVAVLPVHSCMTADSMGSYLSLSGEELDHMRSHRF
jgi:D-serine deaminase-like pyridoxal phosphate-dependent protein